MAINEGELVAANAGALGNASSISVASGTALQLSGGITVTPSGTSTLPLSLSGTGYGSPLAGALDSEAGSNAYPGAITLAGATTINSGTATDTLTLTGGITTTTHDLTFTGAGNITITKAITSTDIRATAINYNGTGMLTLTPPIRWRGASRSIPAPCCKPFPARWAARPASTSPTAPARPDALQGGVTTNGAVPVSFAVGGGTQGVLQSVSGANTFSGSMFFNGPGTVTSSSATPGDMLTLDGAIHVGPVVATFNGAGSTNATGLISGNGASVAYSGIGTLQLLNAANSYTGGTQVNSGNVITAVGGLGSGAVNMNGGTLGFSPLSIGLNNASFSVAGSFDTITAGFSAGVVPIINWNNMNINHGSAPISQNGTGAGDTAFPSR